MPRTRRRFIPDWLSQVGTTYEWEEHHYEGSGIPIGHYGPSTWSYVRSPGKPIGQQVTVDEIHPGWNRFARKGSPVPDDLGGAFSSTKSWVGIYDPSPKTLKGTSLISGVRRNAEFRGPFLAYPPSQVVLPSVTLGSLSAMGTTAIARCKPTNRPASLAVDLRELRSEGLPKLFGATLWKERTHAARAAGGEYLNSEFGWKPLVSDVRSIAERVKNSHAVLSQYERDSGRVVRRRYEFPIETTEVRTIVQNSDGGIEPQGMDACMVDISKPSCQLVKTTRTYKRTWFSGAFTYHLPLGYTSRNEIVSAAAKAGVLTGLELTPENVWNAAPWTWAIDWFSNMGDVVSNVSNWATDGLVLRYGYIMEHQVSSITYTIEGIPRTLTKNVFPSPVFACVETKRREVATPFGFGLSWSGFSPRQIAITVALGLTRRF